MNIDTQGPVHQPGSDEYEHACAGYQRAATHRPDVVVTAHDATDVRTAIANSTQVATQIGGHGLAAPLTGGTLVDLGGLRTVDVDPARRTARVEGGASWQDVLDVAAPHGLAPLSGSAPYVGAVPYTLGGGFGLLSRRYGYAADHVRAFELVTGDGRFRRAEPGAADDVDRELFWALRGGGAGGGVVTAMEIDLVEVAVVYGGCLYVDLEAAPDALDRWRRWTSTVADDVTSGVTMLVFPDVPGVPDELRGRHVAQVQICVADPDGERHVAPLREALPAVRDTLGTWPFVRSGEMFEEPDHPHAYRSRAVSLRGIDPDALATLPDTSGASRR
ncbi:FAD-binding oxidoreductase [Saccharomonospora sp. CUA-673]|uniref:FAD-binding oxidoreductase n=1 Tax=Saccharomonospora sp. CUA-673 TaxID=1904969 RepID=UPI00210078B6|nr:FAD-dependent oxidoreductase [Saccharomonospora sp. CUA-673]